MPFELSKCARAAVLAAATTACSKDPHDGVGDSASEPYQAQECKDYIECAILVDPESVADDVDEYGPGGSCWEDDATAKICARACASARDKLYLTNPWTDACSNGVGTLSLFQDHTHYSFQASFCDGDLLSEEGAKFSATIGTHASWQFSIAFSGWDWIAPSFTCLMDPADHHYACEPADSGDGTEFNGRLDEDLWQFFGDYVLVDGGIFAGSCTLLGF